MHASAATVLLALALGAQLAHAQSRVQYGRMANACDQAKQQVLAAEADDAFALAERRMRLLCGE